MYVNVYKFFLVSHVKTHNSYTCSECQEECASSQALKIHLWNLHKVGKGHSIYIKTVSY